ncbi:DNA topoisomerase 1 [Gossypium arboreum]|uniref:DNA topoisomerase 1 n=1 Tax=Gossypium arboreum TaxID=29729 RepID=A0A0B0NED6_GOSAR|nr:DNA topoisomerase 1 [Gossypium arboreum]
MGKQKNSNSLLSIRLIQQPLIRMLLLHFKQLLEMRRCAMENHTSRIIYFDFEIPSLLRLREDGPRPLRYGACAGTRRGCTEARVVVVQC